MPYVKALPRRGMPVNRGELAHEVSALICEYVGLKGLSYESITDARGALEATLVEFNDRVARPYEDSKIMEGGADPFATLEDLAHAKLEDATAANVIERLRRSD